ncbi:hypothetical protein M9H77_26040 [Catharanthus roseus]|uniref:Uncharacterized protein n=1 Tax=Catharanthus roseus TaxID=4058 RepID=A0ACC0A9X9_CATRO|nr:hypothetical protein M9H77_26040 [Catharanthus roseus]
MAKPRKRRHGPAENMEHGPGTEAAILSVEEPMGDILVFLMGQDDIDAAGQLLSEEAHNSWYQDSFNCYFFVPIGEGIFLLQIIELSAFLLWTFLGLFIMP